MAQFDSSNKGAVSSEFLRTSEVANSPVITEAAISRGFPESSEQSLLSSEVAEFIFHAPGGSVVTLGGTDAATVVVDAGAAATEVGFPPS